MIQEMKSNALAKAKSRKGFTLAELLIVVAIIAILVAIAIPLFAGQLDKAKAATDEANFRSAKAVAVALEMDSKYDGAVHKFFNAKKGEFEAPVTDAYKAQSTGNGITKNDYIKLTNTGTTAAPVLEVVWAAS